MPRVVTPSMTSEQLLRAAQRNLDEASKQSLSNAEAGGDVADEDTILIEALHRLLRTRATQESKLEALSARVEMRIGAVERLLERLEIQVKALQSQIESFSYVDMSSKENQPESVAVKTLEEASNILTELTMLTRRRRT